MNDLDERLRETGNDLVLLTPLSEVVARGRTMRRRRRARGAGLAGAAAAALVAGVVVVTNADSPTSPTASDPVSAGWSSSLNSLPDEELADFTALCRAQGNDLVDLVPHAATDVFNSEPVASTRAEGPSGELGVLIFHSSGAFASCVVDAEADEPHVSMVQSLPKLTETGAFVTPTGTYGSTDLSIATGVTAPEVSAVHITLEGKLIEATVDHGVFAAIVPADATRPMLRAATVTAFDTDGTELERVPLLP